MSTFNGIAVSGIGGYEHTTQLLYNLKLWCDWSFLHLGGFNRVVISENSFYDSDESKLRPVADPRYPVGAVWEGLGREWVWESGLAIAAPPFRPSGVFVDGLFYPTTGSSGIGGHHIDYQRGRVIFDESQSLDADIRTEYCYRSVYVGFGDDPMLRFLMADAIRQFDGTPSGTPMKEHQAWSPSVFIVPKAARSRGLQLGGGQIKTRSVSVLVFAENPSDRDMIVDLLDKQNRKAMVLADFNQAGLPFDLYGDVTQDAQTWPGMVEAYPWKKARFVHGSSTPLDSPNPVYFRGRVDWEIELDFGGV